MDKDERQLLTATANATMQLAREGEELLAGLAAVLLDLYGAGSSNGAIPKAEVLLRLQLRRDFLARTSPDQLGARFLDALIQQVETIPQQPAHSSGDRQLRISSR
jgi:hypothetical protein